MKTLIGIVTFGNHNFTRLCIDGIRETTKSPVDIFVIVGKPGDTDTMNMLDGQRVQYIAHSKNIGFPASINDLYYRAWTSLASFLPVEGYDYDNLIIAGNDIVPYPDGIDSLIRCAADTDWEWICSSQFDSRSLVERYPEARKYFDGPNLNFTNFSARPWDMHNDPQSGIQPDCIKDVRNLCLFKRSVAEKIGYADANFWPGGYFEDNDYCTRALRAGIKACGLKESSYFHFWSRTIHQAGGGSTTPKYFSRNGQFYSHKWGGGFGAEKFTLPFDGKPYMVNGATLPTTLKISDRKDEAAIIEYWKNAQ